MRDKDFVEIGEIVNTFGVRGEVKLLTSTNTPEFVLQFSRLRLGDGDERRVISSRVHGGAVLVRFDGVDTPEAANLLRGTMVYARKSDAQLDEDEHFVDDVIGSRAVNDETGETFGVISDYFALPSNGVYVVRGDGGETLIPAVAEFVRGIDVGAKVVRFRVIEGLDGS
ncbi:MAG: ribosome maturation factor RimM [Oscillospiraceae bacterium]|nr:ribosome maturation factor RimM [Oscillospiraceae bacterium]